MLLAQRALADSSAPVPAPAAIGSVSEDGPALLEHKSTGKAFIMDLAVPGTGHLYAGYKRGWVYLGLEAVAWASYLYYRDLGKQRETEFENYADGHWDYNQWIAACGCSGSPEDSLILYFRDKNSQQYYEEIGKISTYFQGWDSWPTLETRSVYTGLRAQSNNFLDNAHTAVLGAFVNRIVSAVDVLISMKRSGAMLDSNTQMKFRVHTKPFSRDNAVGLELTRRL